MSPDNNALADLELELGERSYHILIGDGLLASAGTKDRTAEELQERLAFLAARLGSSVGETSGSVSMNLLSKDLDEGMAAFKRGDSATGTD